MKNGVKMSDIAEKLGISVVTVSNALAGRDGVSDELRQKIIDSASELGYKPSKTRNSGRLKDFPKGGKNVGIITSERFVGARGTFYWELTAKISNKLSQLNVFAVYECITGKAEKNAEKPDVIENGKVDAVIVIGQLAKNYLKMLSEISIPILFVDFYDDRFDVDSVNSDSYHGAYILTDHLVEMGHRKIGFFGKINATSSISDRFLGYLKCIIENELEYRKEWTINDRNENGTLFDDIDFPEDMPTAFVCNSDETAFRVISALKTKGIRVPEDVSVAGYDNYTVSNVCIPAITTIEVDIEKMAETSVETIMKKLADPTHREGRIIISGRLIVKNSICNLSGKNRK